MLKQASGEFNFESAYGNHYRPEKIKAVLPFEQIVMRATGPVSVAGWRTGIQSGAEADSAARGPDQPFEVASRYATVEGGIGGQAVWKREKCSGKTGEGDEQAPQSTVILTNMENLNISSSEAPAGISRTGESSLVEEAPSAPTA